MAHPRAGQFEVVLSDGLRVVRLPVGLAAGRLWVVFVLSGIRFFAEEQLPDGRFPWETRQSVTFDGPDGPLPVLGGGGGGDGAVQHRHVELEADDLPWLRLAYLDNGHTSATETIPLR